MGNEADVRYTSHRTGMYHRECNIEGCSRRAFFQEPTCIEHCWNRDAAQEAARRFLISTHRIDHLAFDGLELEGLLLTERIFNNCSLRRARISNCDLSRAVMHLCFFEGSQLHGCLLRGADIRRSVFGLTALLDVDFTDSEIVECNFNTSRCTGTTFNDCNLHSSRFIGATLHHVGFRNCNLLNVHLGNSSCAECDFRYSNRGDAFQYVPGRRL